MRTIGLYVGVWSDKRFVVLKCAYFVWYTRTYIRKCQCSPERKRGLQRNVPFVSARRADVIERRINLESGEATRIGWPNGLPVLQRVQVFGWSLCTWAPLGWTANKACIDGLTHSPWASSCKLKVIVDRLEHVACTKGYQGLCVAAVLTALTDSSH